MSQTNKLGFLDSENYTIYNREFARKCGHTAAIMMSELIYFAKKYESEGALASHPKHGDGWFYATIDHIQWRTGILRFDQDSAIKKLVKLGLIKQTVFGLPAKRYFKIDQEKILEFYGIKIELLDCGIQQTGNNNLKKDNQNSEIGPKNREKEITRLLKTTNCYVEDNKLPPYYIYKESIEEEPKENTYAPPKGDACVQTCSSSKSPPKKETIHPKHNVSVTVDEHQQLVSKFGEDLVKAGYEDLSEWKESADPRIVAKHKSDYRRLRKWVIPNLQEEESKSNRISQQNIAPHRRGSKLVTPGDLENDVPKFKRF